jgi:hypothetical protein
VESDMARPKEGNLYIKNGFVHQLLDVFDL